MKHILIASLGLLIAGACHSVGADPSSQDSAAAPAKPEIRYYEIADA